MKKNITLSILIITIIFGLTACGKNNLEKYDLTRTNSVTLNDLSVEIPAIFIEEDLGDDINAVFYMLEDIKNGISCKLEVFYLKWYNSDSIEEDVKLSFYGKGPIDISTHNFNNKIWTKGTLIQMDDYNKYVYETVYEDKVYTVYLTDYSTNNNLCLNALDNVMKSTSFK